MEKVIQYKFLVIDNQDILKINNLTRKVNQAVKHPEPVLKLDAPWDTEKTDKFGYINVLYDRQEQLFKMWYVVDGRLPGQYWPQGCKTAYATSKDGIHWEKPIMDMVEVRGSKKNNYIIPEMFSLYYNIIVDPSDIPVRRYKMTFAVESPETRWAEFHSPIGLAYSADGIHWEKPTHVNPILRGVSDDIWGFLYDPDRRKYQLYTRRVPNLPRDISLYESYDLVNWEDKGRILVGGDKLDPPEMYNLHDLMPFFYEDFCLGLLGTMFFLPGMENAAVYQKPPADWPFKGIGIKDIQLAWSRDGQQWLRPDDRSPVIPIGQPGSPDAGCLFPSRNSPIVIDGETWIYYLSYPERHTSWSKNEESERVNGDARKMAFGMLAKMPEDHWVSLDAGKEEGSFTAKPWGPPHEVFVNADIHPGGSIEVELLTPYGQPMPGYSRAECIPTTKSGKSVEIKWKNGKHPRSFAQEQRGGILTRFHLKNAKLYSYIFTLPDPDGQLEQNKLNARWCEHIKHRSDNWGRNSNEPAKGLPPHSDSRA